jgi:hypothetical protein
MNPTTSSPKQSTYQVKHQAKHQAPAQDSKQGIKDDYSTPCRLKDKGINMAILRQFISPVAKPCNQVSKQGIKYGYSTPCRLKDKGKNMAILQQFISPFVKPCNEVQALVFFIYMNHSKILQTRPLQLSLQLFVWIEIHQNKLSRNYSSSLVNSALYQEFNFPKHHVSSYC